MKRNETKSNLMPLSLAASALPIVLGFAQVALAKPAKIEAIGHQVDVQTTFAESFNGSVKGSLAVGGSAATMPNIIRLAKAFAETRGVKSVASSDFHYAVEMRAKVGADGKPVALVGGKQPLVNDEFQIFPSHGRAEFDHGAEGHERVAEIADLFEEKDQLIVPHNQPNAAGTDLELVPFDVKEYAYSILDPRKEILIYKNGAASYDVFQNPRTAQIYGMINPSKNLPIYVYGWATDFCVRAAALGFAKLGYTNVNVVSDAVAGVFPDKTAASIEEMKAAGVKFVTTDEVLKSLQALKPKYEKKKAR